MKATEAAAIALHFNNKNDAAIEEQYKAIIEAIKSAAECGKYQLILESQQVVLKANYLRLLADGYTGLFTDKGLDGFYHTTIIWDHV